MAYRRTCQEIFGLRKVSDKNAVHDFEEKEGSDEWEECKEVKTLNAMTPIWKRNKGDVKDADYKEFYRATYYDMEEPLHYFVFLRKAGLLTTQSFLCRLILRTIIIRPIIREDFLCT